MPAHSGKFIAYYRVSTDKQGKSGLGLDAQRRAVADYLNGGAWELVAEFTEIESGKRSDRPELDLAQKACRKHKATLVIARLDRLARNVHFVSGLMEAKVKFVACDMPEATPFMLHIYAAVAEQEARAISARTKVALQAAKARGVKLGRHGAEVLAPRYREEARIRAIQIEPIIRELQEKGYSRNRIAAELNKRKVPTPRCGLWDHSSVRNVVKRLAA